MPAPKQKLEPKAPKKAAGFKATVPAGDKPMWAANQIEWRTLGKLTPYAKNSRVHGPAQVDQIAASIKEWGWTIPVLIDEHDGIIAGHGRVLAAQKLGIVDIPVLIARGWSDAQKRAYVIADNKLTLNSTWDEDLLKQELEALDETLRITTGFNDAEFAALIAKATESVDALQEWQGMPEFDQQNKESW